MNLLESSYKNHLEAVRIEAVRAKKKADYLKGLNAILKTPLTIENFHDFADHLYLALAGLINDVIKTYRELNEANDEATSAQLEDKAYAYFELADIPDILDSIHTKALQINAISEYVATRLTRSDEVMVPPDESGTIQRGEHGEGFQVPGTVPRLEALIYLLEEDFRIPKEKLVPLAGQVRSEMMRQTSYVRVIVSDLNRVVYICNEEENASYIFDLALLNESNIAIEALDLMTKKERNALIAQNPKIGRRLTQTPAWRGRT